MISVIIPTYNDWVWLVKTVSSCMVQDINTEIIVVDDCSTNPISDWTVNFLDSLRVQIVRHKTNKGLAEARDTGIEHAHYPYILPLDTGDWLYPHVLGKMAMAIKDVDVVYGNMTERDDGVVCVPPGKNGITKEGMMKVNQLWCSSLFKKTLWENVGGYRNGLHTSYEDYAFWVKCLMSGARFKYLDVLVYRHTYDPNSMLSVLHKNTDYYNELARKPLYEGNNLGV